MLLELDDQTEADTPSFGVPIIADSLGWLGPYKLLSMLGEGTMAIVYAAEHSKLGRRCAIKRLRPEHLVDQEMVQRFLAEARTIARIQHPNLVTLYDVVEEPNEAYLVMELLDGRDLQTALQTGAFSINRALRIAVEICDALTQVHARGIIHRDIKPANIYLCIVNGREQVKMLDFGAAQLRDSAHDLDERMQRDGNAIGSPLYMSPEQIEGGEVDAASDIYAVGVVLYEMLAGKPPFAGETLSDVMLQHLHQEPRPPSALGAPVSRELDALVLRCLAKRASDRYASAADLEHELKRVGASLGIGGGAAANNAASQSLPGHALSVRAGRSWTLPGALVGALVVVSAGIALALRNPERPPPPVPASPSTGVARLDPAAAAPPAPSAPARRNVQIYSEPPGAVAEADGTPDGCITPCMLQLPLGAVRINFRKPEYGDAHLTVAPGDLKCRAELVARRGEAAATAQAPSPASTPRATRPHSKVHSGKRHSNDSSDSTTLNPFKGED